ncbi:hypothetical protein Tco_0355655 [Tanacetum coccineum]
MWNDLILAHERPSDTRDTKIDALRLKFNAFKSLEGEKVNGTFARLKCFLIDLENNGVIIPQAEDNDSDVEEDQRTNNEFMAVLNAEYHEKALLANQKRFYKRSGRVGSARKPIDKSKKICYACGKPAIMEYLVKISKKARILELKRRHLKITVLTSNTTYPSRKIRHICACTSQKTTKETRSIRRIQGRPIRRIQAMEIKYSGRYQMFLNEPTLCPQHIDEFDYLKDETSLSEYDEEEQNILYFNDLFPFNNKMFNSVTHFVDFQIMAHLQLSDPETLMASLSGIDSGYEEDLAKRLRVVYTRDDGQELGGCRRSMTWRQFNQALGLHTAEEMAEDGFEAYWLGSERVIPDKGDLSDYWVEISIGQGLFKGHFIGLSCSYFGLAWVAQGTKRQPVAAAAAPGDVEDAPDIDDGAQAIPAPIHAPLPHHQWRSLRGLMERSMTDQGRFSIWMVSCMTQLMEASGHTYQHSMGPFEGVTQQSRGRT